MTARTFHHASRVLAALTVPVAAFAALKVGLGNGFAPAVLLGASGLFLLVQAVGIPASFSVVFAASMLFHGIAWAGGLYHDGPWDLFSHALTTAAIALALSALAFRPILAGGGMRSAFLIACVGLAAGAGWEILEWGSGLEPMTLDDTITDLIADAVGAAFAALLSTIVLHGK